MFEFATVIIISVCIAIIGVILMKPRKNCSKILRDARDRGPK